MKRALQAFEHRLDVWVQQMEKVAVSEYRSNLISIFNRLLETTPQASGRAVANWRVGINQPDNGWEDDVGDQPEIRAKKDFSGLFVHQQFRKKGDPYWIQYAQLGQIAKLKRVKLKDRVYFSNSVRGGAEKDGREGNVPYLDQLQNKSYWSQRLREENQPYVTAAEVLLNHNWGSFTMMDSTHLMPST